MVGDDKIGFTEKLPIGMNFEQIKSQIFGYRERGLAIFVTSSFQTQSMPLLHIVSIIDRSIPVYFINTGFHFAETLVFRDMVTNLLGLTTIAIGSTVPKSAQKDGTGRFWYIADPDYCCQLNKTEPLEPVLIREDVWINGVRADQTAQRKSFAIEERTPQGAIRFHPFLDWTGEMIESYIVAHDLPRHPLEEKGMVSIGCEPCTMAPWEGEARSGRWHGQMKKECGLHLDLVKK